MSTKDENDDGHSFADPTHPLYKYEKIEKIGEGTYGVVRFKRHISYYEFHLYVPLQGYILMLV